MVDLLLDKPTSEDDDSSSASSQLVDEPNNNSLSSYKSPLGTICEDNEAFDCPLAAASDFRHIDARSEAGSPIVVSQLEVFAVVDSVCFGWFVFYSTPYSVCRRSAVFTDVWM